MEVGKQATHDTETIAGADEDAGLAGVRSKADSDVRLEGSAGGVVGAVLQGAGCSGTSCDDAAFLAKSEVDGISGRSWKGVMLGVKADIFNVLGADRLEGTEAYM